ncbi:tRNA pseudouridine(38-40) synthase TruA [Paraflavitalea sp. CAU 1676]|uniref:tRNA pseudouridine(38-40) synthase TruA n=1 Tax=Paraflavitalea sp. CAU 1676 TaxID=3032598 RepID=UPI0023DCE9E0|nr:tRNA pseudouridine(38-40) synthase TruA [Paraflavitalea sp. CAU 1676]MDF2193741.1 tRNA pseudouridine(38-40) synthase TruA [Paraflavitalea sp. CAU 1676]
MNRYFLEVSYKGTHYAGFQIQDNALTIQQEVEKVLATYCRQHIVLTGSSRTDTGVHALQNYFHFDIDKELPQKVVYNLNAMLPADIAINALTAVEPQAHSRFDAIAREYEYFIYQHKAPFLADRAYYFPYTLNLPAMQEAAQMILTYIDFTSFSKRNSQVRTKNCTIQYSEWVEREGGLTVYRVKGNRFLRGMVRGLVGTMLQVGRGKLSLEGFRAVIEAKDCTEADFSVPGHGLFLCKVQYPDGYFTKK